MMPRPLEGIVVLDVTVNIAGPSATQILSDLGARVIKVEPPGGDVSRRWAPQADGIATVFSAFNRGKESVVLDGKRAEGRELLHRLARDADVFVESMRPGKAAGIGLGWHELHELNPRLIYCSINAFGDAGPMAGVAGFDAVIQAYSGLMDMTGYPDGEPARVGGAIIDVGSGMWAALGILVALRQRDRDGQGRRVPVTMLGTAVGYLMHHLTSAHLAGVEPTRLGTAQHNFAPYQAMRAADQMVMIGINSDAMWGRAAKALGAPHLATDARFATNSARVANRSDLVSSIEATIADMTACEVVERLAGVQVPASAIRSVGDLAKDPQLDALGLWGTTPSGHTLLRSPLAELDGALGDVALPGEQTASVLAEMGFSIDEIDELVRTGVAGEPLRTGDEERV
ncbi:MAG: CaiB/BaiF CoA-transferase family protein [Mycobacterium sp.]